MITFMCPICKKQYNVKDEYGGRQTTCLQCKAKIAVPPPSGKIPDWMEKPKKEDVVVDVVRVATQRCPFCDSEISSAAKKCKHCGETVDVALRAAEEAKRAVQESNRTPMVFMNAGGGGGGSSSSSSSSAAAANDDFAFSRVRRRYGSPGTAAVLEFICGLCLCTFGIGHMYGGNVGTGVTIMFLWWFLCCVNFLLCFIFIGVITLPLCWLAFLIFSPIAAANSCR